MKLPRQAAAGRTYVIAELGINHQGNMDLAVDMIKAAADAGADCVKTQMRTLSKVYTQEELAQARPGVWGDTNRQLKALLEFSLPEHRILQHTARTFGMDYTASPWDLHSLGRLLELEVPWVKIPSPRIGHLDMLRVCEEKKVPVILSTGMSTFEEIEVAVETLGESTAAMLHCVSAYPQQVHRPTRAYAIRNWAVSRGLEYGYSGHEAELYPTIEQVRLGATIVERHVTLDRNLWGSDQQASMTLQEFGMLVREIRAIEGAQDRRAWEDTDPTHVHHTEEPARAKLWRTQDL